MGIVKACLTFFFCPHVFIISYAGDLKTFRLWCFRSTFSKHTFLFRDQIKKKKKTVFFSQLQASASLLLPHKMWD